MYAEAGPITGTYLISGVRHDDERGFLERVFDMSILKELIAEKNIVQMNRTLTHRSGTVRGMHCQLPPSAEIKIVRCLKGRVFDVTVDLRESSPTFGSWCSYELNGDDNRFILIPEGCAHGLQTLSDECEMLYLHTAPYSPQSEAGISPFDPAVGICWPISVTSVSEKDKGEVRSTEWFRSVQW